MGTAFDIEYFLKSPNRMSWYENVSAAHEVMLGIARVQSNYMVNIAIIAAELESIIDTVESSTPINLLTTAS